MIVERNLSCRFKEMYVGRSYVRLLLMYINTSTLMYVGIIFLITQSSLERLKLPYITKYICVLNVTEGYYIITKPCHLKKLDKLLSN